MSSCPKALRKRAISPPVTASNHSTLPFATQSSAAACRSGAENGSHLAATGAAESHAGQVEGPGGSGNAGIGSHLEAAGAAEGRAGQVGGPGSSGNAGIGSHLAEVDAAEGLAG